MVRRLPIGMGLDQVPIQPLGTIPASNLAKRSGSLEDLLRYWSHGHGMMDGYGEI